MPYLTGMQTTIAPPALVFGYSPEKNGMFRQGVPAAQVDDYVARCVASGFQVSVYRAPARRAS
jgi:hypothetical protein